jgi:ABC-type branched-subunit amino acid transport system ATPase component
MRLEVRGLVKAYGGITALDEVAFALDRPGITGLIGPNGAGKTTLFDVMTGRVAPDRGTVALDGKPITGLNPYRIARLGISRTFQECRILPDETCLDNLLFALQRKTLGPAMLRCFAGISGQRRADIATAMRMLELVRLEGYAHSKAGGLSFGQKRLLEIGGALIIRPRMVLLDEPASGVNPTLLNVLKTFILAQFAERPTLVVVVEHNMGFLMSLADRVIVMHQGRILDDGPPASVRANKQVVDAYLG